MKRLKHTIGCCIIIALIPLRLSAQIKQVEPINWWVGMKNEHLQLLVHATGIGEMIPAIDYAGVSIKAVNKADSKDYLFIDLIITGVTKPGTMQILFKMDGKVMYRHDYSLLKRQQDAAQFKGFTAADVIYLITPDRFANGDYSNDIVDGLREATINRNLPGARHGGDIAGIINHLDYIASMGFTAIWPNPLLENDMPNYSYHGYAITNHYKVDPRYGTLEQYKELAAKAKEKGLKLIFDGVVNHTGINYWWMNDLPFRDWINNPDSVVMTNHRRTVQEDLYAAAYDKKRMIDGWFSRSMPDLNSRQPFLANYLVQNSIWWIETLQLGGLRQDTYCYSDKEFLKQWSCSIMNEYPEFNLVGEEWSLNPLITSYWQAGKANHDGYTGCLKSSMDFPLQAALVEALKEPENSDFAKGMTGLYEALANDFIYAAPDNLMVFGDNHDMDRLYTQLNQDVGLTRMALAYLLTIRGIPQIYYGTEVLMDNAAHLNNHGVIRSDFPGGWKEDISNAFTGVGLSEDQRAMQLYLKQLLNWRKNRPVIAAGETIHFAPFDGIYVYFRFNKDAMVMVVMNKNNEQVTIDMKRFSEMLRDKKSLTNIITKQKSALTNQLALVAKSTMIFEVE
jgi:glycosidase